MTFIPDPLNTRFRSKAVITPQNTAKACVPYWFRGTDRLVAVIIMPTGLSGDTLTFDVYDPESEKLMKVARTLRLDDEEGLNVFLDLPSTVMEWVRNPVAGQYCLCLMTETFVEGLNLGLNPALSSVNGEGKWPRTAGLDERNRLMKILGTLVRKKELARLIDPDDFAYLKRLLPALKGK